MAICVTGGSSGIGRAIAERFADPGADVFINYHADDDSAAVAGAAIEERGARAHLVKADVSRPAGAEALAAAVSAKVERLDQFVHAAAKPVPGPLLEVEWEDLQESVLLNGLALIGLVRASLSLLGPGSSVFYITSRGSQTAIRGYGGLGIGKALGEHIVRHLATEMAPRGVRVNSICPGPLDTKAFRAMFPDHAEKILAGAARSNPSGRPLGFDDVAALVATICEPGFEMVQGQTITVDGGLSLSS